MPEENSKAISLTAKDEAEAKKRIAEFYLSPELNAARLTVAFNPKSSLDLVAVVGKLAEHAKAANDGDLTSRSTTAVIKLKVEKFLGSKQTNYWK